MNEARENFHDSTTNAVVKESQPLQDPDSMDTQHHPLYEESMDELKNEQVSLYSSVPPWEYIMHHTVASLAQSTCKDVDRTIDIRSTTRLRYLMNSVEKLLNEFKYLVNSTCCATSKENDGVEDGNNTTIEDNCIVISDNMAILLGLHNKFSSKLFVVDAARIDNEYQRCSSVVDAVVQMLCYKDMEDGNFILDELSNVPMIKEEEDEDDYEVFETNSTLYSNSNQIKQDNEINDDEERDFQTSTQTENGNKLLVPYSHVQQRSTGYYPGYCIPEEAYNQIIAKGKPFICRCERQFINRNTFESHLDGKCIGKEGEIRKKELQAQFKKNENNTFQCLYHDCNEVYNSSLSMYYHHQNDHLKDIDCPYKCDKCDKTFFLCLLLNSHYKDVHDETDKELCKICGKNVKSRNKLRIHMRRHHRRYQPMLDDISIKNEIKLESQDVDQPGITNLVKELNQRPTSITESGMQTHRTKRKRIKPRVMLEPAKVQAPNIPERYPCGKKRYKPVGYYSEYSISKELYMQIISKGKPYICACHKQFVHRHTFERHLYGNCLGASGENKRQELHAKWRKDDNGMFHCLFPGCNETFKYNLSLYSHHQKEHLEGVECPHKCDQCDKSFFLRSLLNCHIKDTHEKRSSQNSQVCDICGKDVIRNQMKLHMMRHAGEKPFKCNYCEYRGLTNSAVLQHVKHVHEPHKFTLHFCDMCGKDCKTKAHLKEHILTHSDKRTFLCKVCGKYLKNRNSFGRHMVRVHKISHTCDHCGVDYFTLQGLQIHLLKVHNITS